MKRFTRLINALTSLMKTVATRSKIILQTFRSSEFAIGTTMAIIIGVVGGLGAYILEWLIGFFNDIFFDKGGSILGFMGPYYVILIPAIGGLIIGLIILFTRTKEAKGHGVPEVMEAVGVKGGRIRPRVAVVKILASALCIGSGGSVGREGPIVQVGATMGSTMGQWLRLPQDWVKTLVACGAAGGISATFNAPIAGVFFAHEIILGRILTRHFGFVVISSVIASVVAHILLGTHQTFATPAYVLNNYWELVLYFILGILSAFVAIAFIRTLYKIEDFFDAMKIPEYVKPAVGGLAVGAIGFFYPYLFGVGYQGIELALMGKLALLTLIPLLILKILAASFTLGSGGSGGVFAPSLFLGAMFGAIFGQISHYFFPDIAVSAGAYAIVGMATVFSAATRAPITGIIILFEMTQDYNIILPLMLGVVVSTLISYAISKDSIYTLKLKRQGVSIRQQEEVDLLEKVRVEEVMTRNFPTIPADMLIPELVNIFARSTHHGFPVINKNGKLTGMVTLSDVEETMGKREQLTVADITTTDIITAYPDETLHDVVHRLGTSEVGRIPVVDRKDRTRLIGVLRRYDIVKAYAKAMLKMGRM
jgi:CIC family chloride channel protein